MPFLSKLAITGYKSLRDVRIDFSDVTILVGQNGAGKSNLVDALRFVRDILSSNLDHALRVRGGLGPILRRSSDETDRFSISLILEMDHRVSAKYGLTIGKNGRGKPGILKEACWVRHTEQREAHYRVENGRLEEASFDLRPPIPEDRPYLNLVSGFDEFTVLYEELQNMGFYNFEPAVIRKLQSPSADTMLKSDGANLAAVYGEMTNETRYRILTYLKRFVPGLVNIRRLELQNLESLEFWQNVTFEGDADAPSNPTRFRCADMSDGTLRACAVLVACFQHLDSYEHYVPLVVIEEPELALHPAAAGILMAAFQEVSVNRQILLTTHSPDLLDMEDVALESIFAVSPGRNGTVVAPMSKVGRESVKENLLSAGELLRLHQIVPDEDYLRQVNETKSPGEFIGV